ncbi:MAG TPA: M48 family metallopeptidase [Rhodanobacteraceae bacterium]|nr:M48 family metallopeptidase [Rhodanobacteraceae bacterium]
MDFFAQQARVKRNARWLVVLFVLAVTAIVAAVDLICAFFVVGPRPGALLAISIGVVVLIGLCSLYRVASLRGGGSAVAVGMGATPVPADTSNPAWKRLRNVIEEVAIASGVPVPEIWVMENEPAINAFAAGYTPADAAVCVTQGCLDKLDRDELQGVIAHEFSHVLNGDMRLNIRLIGLLFGILAIGIVGRFMMYSSSGRSRRNSGNLAVAGIALFVIGYIGLFFGKLIQAAVARARESLADASAVQFTRQTSGIAGALKKIAALADGSQLQTSGRDEVRHMLFGDADLSSLFATHPPILKRIRALEPQFDPKELDSIVRDWVKAGGDPDSINLEHGTRDFSQAVHEFAKVDGDVDVNEPVFAHHAGAVGAGAAVAEATGAGSASIPNRAATLAITASAVAAQVGTPGADDYRAAAALRARIPDALAASARDSRGALAVVFALVLSEQPDLQRKQVQAITQTFDASTAQATRGALEQAAQLHPMLRLPLAQLAFPALKRRPRPELGRFVSTLDALIRADDKVELDEYCIAKLVQVQVIAALDPAAHFQAGSLRLHDAQDALRDLCALMAHFGADDEDSARRAFLVGMQEALPGTTPLYAIPDDWQTALDSALAQLARLAEEGKQLTVRALTQAIAADGVVNVAESELLRVTCAALGCPLPVNFAIVQDRSTKGF